MRRRSSGNMALEAAMFIPVLVLMIVGVVQFGKVEYLNFTLKKIVYAAARQLSTAQGINFCDLAADTVVQNAIQFAVNDTAGTPIISNLTNLQVDTQCSDPSGGGLVPCAACASDINVSPRPDFLIVSIPGGYPVQIRIPFRDPVTITLNPTVMVPFGGVS